MGAHGHGGMKDLIFGTTINPVRHAPGRADADGAGGKGEKELGGRACCVRSCIQHGTWAAQIRGGSTDRGGLASQLFNS